VFRGAHSKIFWRGVTYFGTNFLRVYILEVGVTRGATMVGAERKHFKTLNSLDLRKASCRAQKGIRFRQCIMAIGNSVTLSIIFWTLSKKEISRKQKFCVMLAPDDWDRQMVHLGPTFLTISQNR
jgi:hypothetical protein